MGEAETGLMLAYLGARKVWIGLGVLSIAALASRIAQADPEPASEKGAKAPPLQAPRDCVLSVDAGRRDHYGGRLEYYGGLSFTSPFGGCTSDAVAPASRALGDDLPARSELDDEGVFIHVADPLDVDAERTRELGLGAAEPEEPVRRAAPSRRYVVSPRLARDVIDAAWRAAGLTRLALDLTDAAERARWSAALPELRLRGARGFDESARVDYEGEAAGETRVTGSADLDLEVRLTWRFSELLFAGPEPTLLRMQQSLLVERRAVAKSALTSLMRFQRAQNLLLDESASPEEQMEAMLLASEAQLELAVLTDGWFSPAHVRGTPWPLTPDAASPSDEAGPRGAARPSRGQKAALGASPAPRGRPPAGSGPVEPHSASPAKARAVGANPGEDPAPGVHVPRDVGRDAKQTDGPQEAR